ncbi:MAG: helix-turn-helix transcriptional regulator [Caulobacter sp.]|nr:helix-turn-helix transcriptional regulator [Caulobacter sp.]
MEQTDAVAALSALAHPGRLAVFRLLVKAGAPGLPAGQIAEAVGSLSNTLSANLNILSQAGLVHSRRDGRQIIYTADYDAMRGLLTFLVEDCCQGEPAICGPLTAIASGDACGPRTC